MFPAPHTLSSQGRRGSVRMSQKKLQVTGMAHASHRQPLHFRGTGEDGPGTTQTSRASTCRRCVSAAFSRIHDLALTAVF